MSDTLHIVCPHCHKTNRVPVSRVQDAPHCGACKHLLFGMGPVELDDLSLPRHLQGDQPVLVDFWASWCGPCQMMAPEFKKAAGAFEGRVRFAKVNTEVAQQTAARYAIRSIPTLILFHQGREIARQAGAMSAGQISQWLNSALGAR